MPERRYAVERCTADGWEPVAPNEVSRAAARDAALKDAKFCVGMVGLTYRVIEVVDVYEPTFTVNLERTDEA